MKTLVIQSFRAADVPAWVARCMVSVRDWALASGLEYRLTDDSVFALCGDDYLATVGDNKQSITNLCRLELLKAAHAEGFDRAIWIDADIFVFDPANFRIDATDGITLTREAYMYQDLGDRLAIELAVNNSVVVCQAGEPDLDLIIQITRHIARHHVITSNYQLGADVVKGLHRVLKYPLLDNVGMFGDVVINALARGHSRILNLQAAAHGAPIFAANLSAGPQHIPPVAEAEVMRAMDLLEATRGGILNDRLNRPLYRLKRAVMRWARRVA